MNCGVCHERFEFVGSRKKPRTGILVHPDHTDAEVAPIREHVDAVSELLYAAAVAHLEGFQLVVIA